MPTELKKSAVFLSEFILLTIMVIFFGCAPKQPKLIPREVLFGNPDKYHPEISPDGTYLAYLAPKDDVLNIWIRTFGKHDDHPLTNDTTRDIYYYNWTYNSNEIIYSQDKEGTSDWLLYAVTIPDGKQRPLFDFERVHDIPLQAKIVKLFPNKPDEALVSFNLRDPGASDLYHLNIRTGELVLLQQATPYIFDWLLDWDGNVRGYLQAEDDGGQSMMYRDGNSGPFRKEIVWKLIDDSSWFLFFHQDNKRIYLKDSRGLNATALVLYDPADQSTEMVAQIPDVDLEKTLLDSRDYSVQAATFAGTRTQWVIIDDRVRQDFALLNQVDRGDIIIVDYTLDFNTWLVAYMPDNGPIVYYTYNRKAGNVEKLFVHREALLGLPLVTMDTIQFKARDGVLLHGYLSLPYNHALPAPTVVFQQRASHLRWQWGYNPEVQWFANRGYACLQVNHRGKMGFGKVFQNLGNREMGGKILADLEDAVQWAVKQGYSDQKRLAIGGVSNGGYDALCAVTYKPDLFKAAVAVSGYDNLVKYLSSIPPQWERFRTNIDVRVGKIPFYENGPNKGKLKDSTDWTPEEREEIEFLQSRSPFYGTDKVKASLLIAHGGKDYLYNVSYMGDYVKRLKANGVKVDYIVYEKEMVDISLPENRMDFLARIEKFLAAELGGRYEK